MSGFRLLVVSLVGLFLLQGCASFGLSEPRQTINLNSDWRFQRADEPVARLIDFDDSSWESISLPHTWNNLDGQDGGNNYYRGGAWYRRHLTFDPLTQDLKGKSLFLRFDGAAILTDLFVNGHHVGVHHGMFGAFCFDVTPYLNISGDNILAVRADNSIDTDMPPLSADFTFFGGLYRSVHLLALNPVSITPLDDAGPGVYIKQSNVNDDHADLEITTKLRNATAEEHIPNVKCDLIDARGNVVASVDALVNLPAGGRNDSVQTIPLDHPHLWNGRKDPYLYQMRVTVTDENQVVDSVTQPVGVRYFRVDPNLGFFLNGQSYPLHGVCRHQDRPDQGWAISPAEHEEDFNFIMEMGCTAIRLAHYEHAQEFYDLCDRGGLIVWAESCLVNEVTPSKAFTSNAEQQLRELIKQNYNHPSICFWSVFNELRDTKGLTGKPLNLERQQQVDLVTKLNAEAHELDPTRLTTAATLRPPEQALNQITDIQGFNRYIGWYVGVPADWPSWLDGLHKALPNRCIGISEYGAGASVYQHEFDPKQPKPTSGPWHPEEWQCTVHEAAYAAMKQRPWLWGTFIWNMFDFASDMRREGDHSGRNDKGMVTYDRKTKKDVFYFYKANWSDDPFAYITDRRFSPRNVGDAPIKIYSNCDSVDLLADGTDMGVKTSDNHIFIWNNVILQPGPTQLEAIGTRGGKQYADNCTIVFIPNLTIVKPTTLPEYDP
jgi:beta-galactosidase